MSSIPSESQSTPTRTSSVVMGRQDFFSVLLRLIGMELYKIRRRSLSKVLSIIAIIAAIGIFLIIFLISIGTTPTDGLASLSDLLHLPTSLYVAEQTTFTLGRVLIITLAGIIVGGEYGGGTVRLLFTRGPTRTQFLLAKMGALLACIVIGLVGMTLLGLLAGQLFTPLTGASETFDFFTAAWVGYAFLYLLAVFVSLFVYAMLAVFFATLGRTTAAGIGLALVWIFVLEGFINFASTVGRSLTRPPTSEFLAALPNFLIGNNVDAILQNQAHSLFGNGFVPPSNISDAQGFLVLIVYLLLFTGLTWWITKSRDVAN